MNPSRALVALAVATAVSLTGFAPAASADTPALPLTLVGPVQGATVTTPYPVFSWVAPEGETSPYIFVSTKPTVRANGKLPVDGKNSVWSQDLADGATSVVDRNDDATKAPFSPGTYYWQVQAYDSTNTLHLSAVQKFTIPLVVELSKERAKIGHMQYNGQRAIIANATVKCNYPEDQYYTYFYMDVYKGKKRISHGGQQRGDCVGMMPVKAESAWAPPASLKSGTKLTIKLYMQSLHDSTVKYGGANIPKNKSAVSTVRITWKK